MSYPHERTRPSLETRARSVPIRKRGARQDPRGDAEYAAALARETDRSLRDKRLWPYTGPQRWRPKSSLELGYGTNARAGLPTSSRRWAK